MTPADPFRVLHEYLTGRGWKPEEWAERDEDGYPTDPEDGWTYPASFGGAVMNQVPDITPSALRCWYERRFDETTGHGETALVVRAVGNFRGCDAHDTTEYRIPYDETSGATDFAGLLGDVLADLEPPAQVTDPRALIECRFFGPCGRDS